MKIKFINSVYKYWRMDVGLWEEKLLMLWFIPYYRYSIWKDGKTIKYIRLIKYSNPKYLKKAIKTVIYVGKKEFEEKYNNNKYLVPLNYVLDLTKN